MRTERDYLTASNNRWICVLLIFLVVIPLLYNIIMPIDTEEPATSNGTNTVETTSTLSLKNITKSMDFVCLNDYVYMHPNGYPRDLEPVLINGNDISTGTRLVPCDDYELVYNAVLRAEGVVENSNE